MILSRFSFKNFFRLPSLKLLACLMPLLLTFAVGAGLRLYEVPDWDRPELTADGEILLSKHDGYGWLAGAKQINQHSAAPFSTCIRILHETTGIPYDRIAFWLPAVLAPLAALPVFLLALWWGIPEAGIAAGIMAGSSIGFFIRSRVTCLDTDLISLCFPLCLAAGLIMWIESMTPPPRGRGNASSSAAVLFQAFLLGLLYHCYTAFYHSGETVGLSIAAAALAIGLIFSEARFRMRVAAGILILLLAGDGPWQETAVAAAMVLLAFWRPGLFERRRTGVALLFLSLAALWWFSDFGAKAADIWFHISRYGRVVESAGIPGLPPVINNVPEAMPVSLKSAVFFTAGNWPLFIAGLLGLVIVLWKRPSALLLLPLLILGMGSMKLGIRFTMYGGAILGIGLACGTAFLLGRVQAPRWVSVAVQFGLAIAVCWPLARTVAAVDPEPVVTTPLAGALLELKQQSKPDAQVWTWWDQGYAAQYYGERMTLTDGYRNAAEEVFPQAYVYSARSPLPAYQMMVRTLLMQQAAGPDTGLGSKFPIYPNPFVDLIQQAQAPIKLTVFLNGLGQPKAAWSHDLPEQYLVLTWEGLKKAHSILSYGTWDFLSGRSGPGRFVVIWERADIDMKNGVLTLRNNTWSLSSRDMISGSEKSHFIWAREKGWHAVSRAGDAFTFLMDDAAYQTMMVQMLLSGPEAFAPYFDLVVDRFPFVRIYRVNPILTRLPGGAILPEGGHHEG